MRTEKTSAVLIHVLAQLRPKDLLLNEHRHALSERIEKLLTERGWDKLQFGRYVRMELNDLRQWLADTRELTADSLAEICGLFHISIGDLVRE